MGNNSFDRIRSNLDLFIGRYIVFIGIFILILSLSAFFFYSSKAEKEHRKNVFSNFTGLELKETNITDEDICRMNQEALNSMINLYHIINDKYPSSIDDLYYDEFLNEDGELSKNKLSCSKGEYSLNYQNKISCSFHGVLDE